MLGGFGVVEGGEGVERAEHAFEGVVDETFVGEFLGVGVVLADVFEDIDESFHVLVAFGAVGELGVLLGREKEVEEEEEGGDAHGARKPETRELRRGWSLDLWERFWGFWG